MNEQFQQAVVASRAGQIKEAQFLLAQSLQDEPENADAWLLLSQLVDSEEKKQTYLAKAVALDPDHELANEYHATPDGDAIIPVVAEELDDMADLEAILDADVDESLPDLDDSDADMDDWLAAAVAADSVADEDEMEALDAVESIDFAELMEEPDDEMVEKTAVIPTADDPIAQEEKEEVEVEKKEEETAVIDPKTAKRQKDAANLNYMIYGLMVIGILIVLYMVYLLLA